MVCFTVSIIQNTEHEFVSNVLVLKSSVSDHSISHCGKEALGVDLLLTERLTCYFGAGDIDHYQK